MNLLSFELVHNIIDCIDRCYKPRQFTESHQERKRCYDVCRYEARYSRRAN